MPTETELHRALADPSRRRVLEELRAARRGLDVHELARRLALHPNTVRWHLATLGDVGLVRSHAAPHSGRGRPRMLYRSSEETQAPGRDEYRLLATILAGTVSAGAGGAERAEDAGRAWGRYLVGRPAPNVHVTDAEAVDEVAQLLDEQGFRPETTGTEIAMRRCPFHDLAEQHPDIVCAVHRGLISGALEELDSTLEVERLDVFVEPDLCVARLGTRAS